MGARWCEFVSSRCLVYLGSWCLVFFEGLLCVWRWGDVFYVLIVEFFS